MSEAVDPKLAQTLQRLGSRGRHIPFVQQLEAADCGAACLAMVLGSFGKTVALDELRGVIGSNRGTDASEILSGAARYGLRGRGIQLELEDLVHLPSGTILHWAFNHFVVLDRVRRTSVDIVDPASGRRRIAAPQRLLRCRPRAHHKRSGAVAAGKKLALAKTLGGG